MDLQQKIRTLPTGPGVYMYKNAEGEVIYVGKAKNLRSRVRSYFQEGVGEANAKTGSLLREAVDVDYIVVAKDFLPTRKNGGRVDPPVVDDARRIGYEFTALALFRNRGDGNPIQIASVQNDAEPAPRLRKIGMQSFNLRRQQGRELLS